MANWPSAANTGSADFSGLAERIALLLDCPWAAVWIQPDSPEFARVFGKIAFRQVKGAPSSHWVDLHLIETLLRVQLERSDELLWNGPYGSRSVLKQVQISREATPLADILSTKYLNFATVTRSRTQLDGSDASVGAHLGKGVIIVGSSRPLSDLDQSLLLAAAQKCSELWTISHLEEAIRLRNQFLSIASHELKTPLTSIYGILQLQERAARSKKLVGAPLSEEDRRQANFSKISIKQVQRLNELIDGLLDVARIQNGRFMVEPSKTEVAGLIRETVGTRLSLVAEEAHVSVQVESPEKFQAWVDPVRMEEVVTNLVMNAIRFSPEGGIVSVRLLGASNRDQGAFKLMVRDQGPAVPLEDRERIFKPFERAPRTQRFGGLGLGLYISREIAQLHGGNIILADTPGGQGNIFEAYFPAAS